VHLTTKRFDVKLAGLAHKLTANPSLCYRSRNKLHAGTEFAMPERWRASLRLSVYRDFAQNNTLNPYLEIVASITQAWVTRDSAADIGNQLVGATAAVDPAKLADRPQPRSRRSTKAVAPSS